MAAITAAAIAGGTLMHTARVDYEGKKAQEKRDKDFQEMNQSQVDEANEIARHEFDESNRIAKESTERVNRSIEQSNKLALMQREKSLEFIQKANRTSRGDMFNLFGQGQQSRQKGIQAGLDLFGQTVPAQIQAIQQGNAGAQNALMGGSYGGPTVIQDPTQGISVPEPQLAGLRGLTPGIE